MFIPTVAAIVTLVGAGGLVVSSLAPAIVGDGFFNFAATCLVAGPLIFFFYVIAGLCREFVAANRPAVLSVSAFASSSYAPASPGDFANEQLPEGLRRERKGPLNPSSGRATGI